MGKDFQADKQVQSFHHLQYFPPPPTKKWSNKHNSNSSPPPFPFTPAIQVLTGRANY